MQQMLYIGKSPKGKIPHTWHFWNIEIRKPPYVSSLKIIGLLHFLNFWVHQKKITIYSLFGSPCREIIGGKWKWPWQSWTIQCQPSKLEWSQSKPAFTNRTVGCVGGKNPIQRQNSSASVVVVVDLAWPVDSDLQKDLYARKESFFQIKFSSIFNF